MNRRQKICLWIGIVAFVLMGLFPPWFYIRVGRTVRSAGYAFILSPPPQIYKGGGPVSLDFSRLCFNWALVVAITAGLVITFKDKKQKEEQKE